MFRWILGRRRSSAAVSILAVGVAMLSTAALTISSAFTGASPRPTLSRQQVAQHILNTRGAVLTAPAQAALQIVASGNKQLGPGPLSQRMSALTTGSALASGGAAPQRPSFTNVRVNDPAADTHQVDQTTQSETAIAVAGRNVVVGYNDSQTSGLALTAGTNLDGYSYSADGGASFTDGGVIRNAPQFTNFGDPWLTSDRAGAMYYSTLALDGFRGNLDVAVAKSGDGGKTFGTPVTVYRPPSYISYGADKDAIGSGPDPLVKSRDDLYGTWDDFVFNARTGVFFTGLPVAHSTDGGKTWHLVYADKFIPSMRSCTFRQYIGAVPVVDRVHGTLYVVAERLSTYDPKCKGGALRRSEWIFRSTDGGKTFAPGVKIANVTEAVPNDLLFLGRGRYMRDIEFPTIALRGKTVYVAWNDGALGKSHIRLATSANGGTTWSVSFVTKGTGDELQPALSADGQGVHLLYYERNKDNTLDVLVGNARSGVSFVTDRVTTQSSQGALTIPQFDPIIAWGYMGDYIANVSDGAHQYFAWGDNRDTFTDFLFPNGRNDPDVFLAKQ